MRLPVTGLLILALTLGACGKVRESRLNPFNWFGRSETVVVATEGVVPGRPDDPRVLVADVTDMEVARQPGGAIIRASGLPPTQGWWDTALVPENDGVPVDGVLTYRFVLAEPLGTKPVSTRQSRELTAATYISDIKLAGVSQIVVVGAQNSRASRR
ncbi:hypothetical protein OEZ71_13410 [Defluviimonas sp. WL0050]|uniref:Lipoprotein n=1 Tax=Albidovulum litorale TaxID=2984134 RepID=A0ABT2ZQH7_9RHOB|nr:hypothetical protein [Defluviimonas sp. WL0050]MCV2873292.1 hypothetical protein [Defluviimonas sp. WL0050]